MSAPVHISKTKFEHVLSKSIQNYVIKFFINLFLYTTDAQYHIVIEVLFTYLNFIVQNEIFGNLKDLSKAAAFYNKIVYQILAQPYACRGET